MTAADLPEAPIPDTHVGILETALMAMVSTISRRDGLISTNPVGFDWDGEYVRLSTLKSRRKYHNLVANPQVTFCAVDPAVPTRYLEIRGYAELSDDPERTLSKKLVGRTSGKEVDLDEPDAQRVIIKIVPTSVSAPTLYGGRMDQRATEHAVPQSP
ncbi:MULTISPECIES: TIGR03618 family F420-dependent PPOX class oxidoreductase [unclassified Mycobacterium]|uniref:TIGR03618 family F420-dependent PPOX class oxidoreductase n=1 Tax=unclassified Mycobacterium TaxID=2642494 RepID=UPI0029C6867B|nr:MULTISPECIES: TIGR03618 family F420-dependent PPOX class oxidoreductase [unclassified Mycobacterium]